MIRFTDEEKQLIESLSVVGGWDDAAATPLKHKIKPYLLEQTSECCCYCRRSMQEWHQITIDSEHVLPKSDEKFAKFTFELRNLSVSCKRCNMGIKRADTSFYVGAPVEEDPFKSEYYTFIHPNLDVVDDHLQLVSIQFNTIRMVKYSVVNSSPKGTKTKEYFKLERIEVNSFDGAQGLEDVSPSESLPRKILAEIEAILESTTDGI